MLSHPEADRLRHVIRETAERLVALRMNTLNNISVDGPERHMRREIADILQDVIDDLMRHVNKPAVESKPAPESYRPGHSSDIAF